MRYKSISQLSSTRAARRPPFSTVPKPVSPCESKGQYANETLAMSSTLGDFGSLLSTRDGEVVLEPRQRSGYVVVGRSEGFASLDFYFYFIYSEP